MSDNGENEHEFIHKRVTTQFCWNQISPNMD